MRFLAVLLPLAFLAFACSDTAPPTLEEKLAEVNEAGPTGRPTSPATFGRLLDTLDAKCFEGRQEIADLSVKAFRLLADGLAPSLWGVMSDMNRTLRRGQEDCTIAFAVYAVEKGG